MDGHATREGWVKAVWEGGHPLYKVGILCSQRRVSVQAYGKGKISPSIASYLPSYSSGMRAEAKGSGGGGGGGESEGEGRGERSQHGAMSFGQGSERKRRLTAYSLMTIEERKDRSWQ